MCNSPGSSEVPFPYDVSLSDHTLLDVGIPTPNVDLIVGTLVHIPFIGLGLLMSARADVRRTEWDLAWSCQGLFVLLQCKNCGTSA